MKVFVTTDCVGGVWTYALELARGLSAAGHDVFLAVMGDDLGPDQQRQLDDAPLADWAARPYRLEWMAEPEGDLAAAGDWLLELASGWDADVIHLNQFSHATLPWGRPTVVVAHSDVVTWWRAVHGGDPGPEWNAYRDRVAAGLQAADVVVAPTAAMADELRAAYSVCTRCRVIANGRRLGRHSRAKEPVIAAAGRVWDEAKNVAAAVGACDGVPWPLAVAGPGGEAGVAGDTTRYLGRLSADEVTEFLAAASIFVAPARYEPFGLAALEAGLMGCALVLGDIASLREVWGDAALYVQPDDVPGLRHVLLRLTQHEQQLAERQNAAESRAQQFTAERMTTAYLDLYRELLAVGARPVVS